MDNRFKRYMNKRYARQGGDSRAERLRQLNQADVQPPQEHLQQEAPRRPVQLARQRRVENYDRPMARPVIGQRQRQESAVGSSSLVPAGPSSLSQAGPSGLCQAGPSGLCQAGSSQAPVLRVPTGENTVSLILESPYRKTPLQMDVMVEPEPICVTPTGDELQCKVLLSVRPAHQIEAWKHAMHQEMWQKQYLKKFPKQKKPPRTNRGRWYSVLGSPPITPTATRQYPSTPLSVYQTGYLGRKNLFGTRKPPKHRPPAVEEDAEKDLDQTLEWEIRSISGSNSDASIDSDLYDDDTPEQM